MVPLYEARPDRASIFYSSGLTFPPHMHSHIELAYVEEGEIEVCVDGVAKMLTAGDLAVVFPNQIHNYQSKGRHLQMVGNVLPGQQTEAHYTFVYGKDAEENVNKVIIAMFPVEMCGELMGTVLKHCPENPFLSDAEVHEDIRRALYACLDYQEADSRSLIIRAYLFLMLAHIMSAVTLKQHEESHLMGHTERIVGYIAAHFSEPVSLGQLSEHLGISKYSISRIIHNKLHTSFSDYVNSLRVNHAQMLLLTTDEKIITVGLNSGYDNLRTFNREFSKLCGCSPKQYRDRHESYSKSLKNTK